MKLTGKARGSLVILMIATPLAVAAACSSNTTFSVPDDDSGIDSDASTADGSSDAIAAPDVTVPTWCQTHAPTAALCADFDEGNPKLAFVHGVSSSIFRDGVSDAGTQALVPSSDSPPSALAFTMGAAADDAGSLGLSIFAPGSPTTTLKNYAFDVDFRIDAEGADPANATIGLGAILLEAGQVFVSCGFSLSGGKVIFATTTGSAASTVSNILGPAPAIGTWVHVSITMSIGATVAVTGQLSIDTPVVTPLANPFASGDLIFAPIFLGIDSQGATGAAGVSYDNLTLVATKPAAGDGG